MAVYAAAGQPGQGVSLQDLQKRTRISERQIEICVKELLEIQLLKYNEGLLEPLDLHLFFKTKEQSSIIATLFQQACQTAAQRSMTALHL